MGKQLVIFITCGCKSSAPFLTISRNETHGRLFSPGTPASSTTKTGRHDIAEIFLKHQKSNQIKSKTKVYFPAI
jgi:hypothetical protein